MRICRIARSWHPSPVSVFPEKRDAYSLREIWKICKIWNCRSFIDFKSSTSCGSLATAKILIAFYNKIIKWLNSCNFSIAASKVLVFSVFENLILHIFLVIIIIIWCSGMFLNVPCSWFYRRQFTNNEFSVLVI